MTAAEPSGNEKSFPTFRERTTRGGTITIVEIFTVDARKLNEKRRSTVIACRSSGREMVRGDEVSGVAARFYEAAATALLDAKHPGEVEQTLSVVRRVVLGDAENHGTSPSPVTPVEVSSAPRDPGTDESSSTPVFRDPMESLTALANEVVALQKHSRWDGFETLGEQMVHVVAVAWLPCFTSKKRASLFDDILDAMPPPVAVRVLVPALGPSRTALGRALPPDAQAVVATEAAAALARAVRGGLAANLALSASETRRGDADHSSADDECRLLISSADRCELPPGAHPAYEALHPVAFAKTLASQFACAAIEASTFPSVENRTSTVAARACCALARRGAAAAVAEALIDAALHETDTANPANAAHARRSASLQHLVHSMPDPHAVEMIASALLKACASKKLAWRATERVLRLTFSKRFWTCDVTRHALTDVLLVRKHIPRSVVPALVRFVVVDPPRPFVSLEAPSTAETDLPRETVALVLEKHRARALAGVADAWSDPEVIRAGTAKIRGHVTSVTAAVLAAVPVDAWRGRAATGGAQVGLAGAASLMRGVSARLDSPDRDSRRHGRKVASALALAIDPAKPLTFDDDEDFGVSDSIDEDVSEDEAEWERAPWELREGFGPQKTDPSTEADAFADSLVTDFEGGDVPNEPALPESVSKTEEEETSARVAPEAVSKALDPAVDPESDPDDPDAAFAMGAGGGFGRDAAGDDAAAADDDDSDSDSDDSDASSSLEPYDMESDDADDSDEDDVESIGTDVNRADGEKLRVEKLKEKRNARRRIASLPRPTSLSACVEALLQKRGAEESSASRSAVDRADACEGAVYAIETLIRSMPEELVNAAGPLVSALVHAHPPTPDAEGLARARRRAIVALAATAPGIAGPALSAEAFATGRCDAGQQLEVLDIIADAARELASLPPVKRSLLLDAAEEEEEEEDFEAFETRTRQSLSLASSRRRYPSLTPRVGVERRFAPRSLARLRDSVPSSSSRGFVRGEGGGASRKSRAFLVVDALAGPLVARLGAIIRTAARDEQRARAHDLACKNDPENVVHVPGGGIDAIVLGRALGALGECCAASRRAWNAPQLAGAVLEVLLDETVHRHRHPHVRRAALFAAYGAVTSVDPAVAWNALAGSNSPSRLGTLLTWAEAWAERARAEDADEITRQLALRCVLSSADLRQKASRVGVEGGKANDALYALKNLTAFAVGEA
jgi:telomere length regulation protein